MKAEDKAREVISAFAISGECINIKVNKQGHINSTFISEFDDNGTKRKYTHQMINSAVFHDPVRIMDNILAVTEHIRGKLSDVPDKGQRCLEVILSKDGKPYAIDEDGMYWRTYGFVDDVMSYDKVPEENIAYNLGKGIGNFQLQLSDFDSSFLYTSLPRFHDMGLRFQQLEEAIEKNPQNRKDEVLDEIEFLEANKERGRRIWDAFESGELPSRVTHNDTKINNVLFSPVTGEAMCVIDLDTIMPGTILFDTGDMIRTACNTADEDEKDVENVDFSVPCYKALLEGYLEKAGAFITEKERDGIKESGRMMAQIMAVRFLTDYIAGDVYYKIDYPEHNLVRARAQIALMKAMDRRWNEF